jgi:multiple sugar transport system substrate-binding protein
MLDKKLSRRDLLKVMGLTTAGAFLAACGGGAPMTEEPADMGGEPSDEMPEQEAAKVIMMYNLNELADEEVAQFNEKYAPIELERIDTDLVKLFSMLAAGQKVDAVRLYGTFLPSYVSKGVALDLTDYFNASEIVPPDDLLPVNDLFVVQGKRYGLVKDWSPDYAIFANKSIWDEMGVELPGPTEDVSYERWRELSSQLTKKEGDRTLIMGTDFTPHTNVLFWATTTQDPPGTLFNEDFTKIVLRDNPDTLEAAKFYMDWMKEGGLPSKLSPHPSGSWSGVDWQQRMAAAVQWGYWFSGMATSDQVPGEDVYMMKAPTWGATYANPCGSGCGIFATTVTDVPDATWKSIEWFMGEEPAEARAASGWGVPAQNRLLDMMPRDEPWRQQCYECVQHDIENSAVPVVDFSPYTTPDSLTGAWSKYQDLVLDGDLTVEEMLAEVEEEVNLSIEEGMQAAIG